MSAYVISEVEFLDAGLAQRYRELAAASIKAHGGVYRVRGATPEAVEGEIAGNRRLVVVEFPSMERAKEWYASAEYAEALQLRAAALDRRLLFVEGLAEEAEHGHRGQGDEGGGEGDPAALDGGEGGDGVHGISQGSNDASVG